jgi:hypothetical protein
MKRLLALLALLATPAFAADNALVITPGAGVIMRTIDDGSAHQIGTSVPVGTNGVSAWGSSGTANPNVLTVQGIAGAVAMPISGNIGFVGTPTVVANQGGTWQVNQGTPPWTVNPGTAANWAIGAFGSAPPGNGVEIGFVGTDTFLHSARVDGAFNIMTNCAVGCSGGTFNNNADGVATSATNGQSAAWLYGFNGTTWDRLRSTPYGTAPGANPSLATTTFVTNATSPGRAAASASSPVVSSAANTKFHLVAAATNNATLVKNQPVTLLSCQMSNNSTTIAYLKIYDKNTAPSPASDTPVKSLIIPGPSTGGGGSNPQFGTGGVALTAGFGIAVVTGIADNNNTAVAASTYTIDCDYDQ